MIVCFFVHLIHLHLHNITVYELHGGLSKLHSADDDAG